MWDDDGFVGEGRLSPSWIWTMKGLTKESDKEIFKGACEITYELRF